MDGAADDLRALPRLPQRDGEVLGSVRLQERNFRRSFLRKFLSGHGQIYSRTLSLGLEKFLEAAHVQVLRRERDR